MKAGCAGAGCPADFRRLKQSTPYPKTVTSVTNLIRTVKESDARERKWLGNTLLHVRSKPFDVTPLPFLSSIILVSRPQTMPYEHALGERNGFEVNKKC